MDSTQASSIKFEKKPRFSCGTVSHCVNDTVGAVSQLADLFTSNDNSSNEICCHESNYVFETVNDEQVEPSIVSEIFNDDPQLIFEKLFVNSYHQNWYGTYGKMKKCCVLSYKQNHDGTCSAIVRTEDFTEYVSSLKCFEPDGEIRRSIIPIDIVRMCTNESLDIINIKPCLHCNALSKIRCYDDLFTISTMNCGIVYQKPGQVTESEMLSNCDETDDFNLFLSLIGRRVRLKGFRGYNGGLDVCSNETGFESLYVQYKRVQVMFHVSTMLPIAPKDPQQILRKRHIGNDNICIIFQKSPTSFHPDQFTSKVLTTFIVVTPLLLGNEQMYKVQVYFKKSLGCKHTVPRVHRSRLFKRDKVFAEWILQKVLICQKQSHCTPEMTLLVQKIRRTRITNLVQHLQNMDMPYWQYMKRYYFSTSSSLADGNSGSEDRRQSNQISNSTSQSAP